MLVHTSAANCAARERQVKQLESRHATAANLAVSVAVLFHTLQHIYLTLRLQHWLMKE